MRASQTQIDAFHSLTEKDLTTRQKQVMAAFDDVRPGFGAFTREEIAAITNMPLSGVCGRVRELLDLKRLAVFGDTRCAATGRYHEILGVPSTEV